MPFSISFLIWVASSSISTKTNIQNPKCNNKAIPAIQYVTKPNKAVTITKLQHYQQQQQQKIKTDTVKVSRNRRKRKKKNERGRVIVQCDLEGFWRLQRRLDRRGGRRCRRSSWRCEWGCSCCRPRRPCSPQILSTTTFFFFSRFTGFKRLTYYFEEDEECEWHRVRVLWRAWNLACKVFVNLFCVLGFYFRD